ncbi:MAG: hypothetical protein AAB289_03635, partial [Chloroflexota bacterium]
CDDGDPLDCLVMTRWTLHSAPLATLSGAAYLLVPAVLGGAAGFPLDDAWIHQTFARNLATLGQIAVNPGDPVSASTSPVWTIVLAAGHGLGLPPQLWSACLGWVLLVALARETSLLARSIIPAHSALHWWAGVLTMTEWRLVWAGFSGMETLLFSVVSLAFLRHAAVPSPRSRAVLGFGAGLLFLIRPEGAILGAVAGVLQLLEGRRNWKPILAYALAAAAVVIPFVLFNFWAGGRPLPATFYAKNAGYGSPADLMQLAAYLQSAAIELTHGPALLLIPGLLFGLMCWARRGLGAVPIPLLWALGLVGAYMIWLPVTYHHGRYLMPLLPIVVIYGLSGSAVLLETLKQNSRFVAAAKAALLLVWVLGWGRGAQILAGNTRSINQQQVDAAVWLRDNTPSSTVVGAHD